MQTKGYFSAIRGREMVGTTLQGDSMRHTPTSVGTAAPQPWHSPPHNIAPEYVRGGCAMIAGTLRTEVRPRSDCRKVCGHLGSWNVGVQDKHCVANIFHQRRRVVHLDTDSSSIVATAQQIRGFVSKVAQVRMSGARGISPLSSLEHR